MRKAISLLVFGSLLLADSVVLKSGLTVEGDGPATERDGRIALPLDGKTLTFPSAEVREVLRGETAREDYARRAAALTAEDAAGWYRLGLWARERRLAKSSEAFERVLAIDPDHRAARRELGYEKVGGEWLGAEEAQRRKGFVLCGGKWMLPAEADRLMRDGLMAEAPVTADHIRRAEEIVLALLDDDAAVRAAAVELVAEVPQAAMMRPMLKVLYAPQPDLRILAIKTIARTGDRTALPWLIRSSMYDASRDVRSAAFRALQGYDDADLFFPYARALHSTSPQARIMAAEALAELGDARGTGAILRRISIGIGEAGRANIMVGKQQSYIQDFDVEIAQSAAIGDPIVQTIRDGIILDFKILGGSGERWIVEENNAYASALRRLTGRDFGQDWKAYEKYAAETK